MNKRVLITGCNGFVAGSLIPELIKNDYKVFGLDLQPNTKRELFDYTNIDIIDKEKLLSYVKDNAINQIYHLAAISNTKVANENPYDAIENNVIGSVALFEICRKLSNVKLLSIGSSEMYEAKGLNVMCEEHNKLSAHSIYGVSKISAEICGIEYARRYKAKIIFTRSFNHTGVGQSPIFVLSDWAKQCAEISLGIRETKINVGNIDISRDFLNVKDVVRAYILLMEKGLYGEVYNVSSGKSYNLKELLQYILKIADIKGCKIEVDHARIRKDEPLEIKGSNEKLKLQTKWEQKYTIERTLSELFEYWKNYLSN